MKNLFTVNFAENSIVATKTTLIEILKSSAEKADCFEEVEHNYMEK